MHSARALSIAALLVAIAMVSVAPAAANEEASSSPRSSVVPTAPPLTVLPPSPGPLPFILSDEQLADVRVRGQPAINACVDRMPRHQPRRAHAPVRLHIVLVIAPSGTVRSAVVTGDLSAGPHACVEQEVLSWVFPPAREHTRMSWSITLPR